MYFTLKELNLAPVCVSNNRLYYCSGTKSLCEFSYSLIADRFHKPFDKWSWKAV